MNIFTAKPLWSYSSLIIIVFFFFSIPNIIAQEIHPYEDTARQYIGRGEFKKGILYLEKAQKAYISQQKHENHLRTYTGLFFCFHVLQEIDSMEKIVNTGLKVAKEYTLTETPTYAYILQAAGVLYHEKGAYAKALSATQKNIDLLKKLGEEENPDNYNNIAATYRMFGDFDTALEYYNKALKLQPKNRLFNHNIGVVLLEKREYKKAIEFFNRSLQFTKKKKEIHATYIDLGHSYQYLGNCDMALSYLEKAKALALLPSTRVTGINRAFAVTYACKKQYSKAHDYINIAIAKYPKGTKHPILGKAYNMKASIYVAQNKHKEALETYDLALNNLVSNFDKTQKIDLDSVLLRPELLEVLIGKAEIKTVLNHPKEEVLELYVFATELIDYMRVNFINDGSKYHLVEKSIPTIYEAAIKLALETGNKALAFELSEKSKAGVLLEKAQKTAARKYLNSAEPTSAGLTFGMFQENSPSTVFNQTFKPNDIQTSLAEDQALVTYFVGKKRTYAFVMNQQRINTFSFENIQQQDIKSLITSLGNSECAMNSTEYTKLAYEVYQKALQPIEQFGDYKRLIIIPDELLSSIPFDALLIEASANGECHFSQLSYVLKKYSIGYAYSANLWYLNKKTSDLKQPNKFRLGAFAPLFSTENQAFCNDTVSILSQLGNQKSAEEIGEIYNEQPFLGNNASVVNFKKEASKYDILHLSTHACMDDNNPENHRIFLSGGSLFASEIDTMRLNARLAVLSACETGRGYLQRGEGVMSLARSFSLAGCPSVVMSLWNVNDESTIKIMVAFHENLEEDMPQDVALQKAKLDYLEGGSNAEMNPYYWAAFVQIGDANSLGNTKGSNSLGYLLALLGVVGVGFFMVRRKS